MSKDYLVQDISWDKDEMVDTEPALSSEKNHFGLLKMYTLKVNKTFDEGKHVTIPDITGGDYDEQDENGLKTFGGWLPGWLPGESDKNRKLFVLVATKANKEGNSYQQVKQYKNKVDGKELHLWGDFVFPSLAALSKSDRAKLTSEGLFASWEEISVGQWKNEKTGDEGQYKVWLNFQAFSSKEEMEAASSEFFSGLSDRSNSTSQNHYPAFWGEYISEMLADGAKQLQEGTKVAEIAKKLKLTGKEAKTHDSEDIDAPAIWQEILQKILDDENVPGPIKADLKQKVNDFLAPF